MKTSDTNPDVSPYLLHEPEHCPSPALLVYPEKIRHNIREMLRMTGGAARLRPHIKTHKMAEVIQMQQQAGINRFKCATLSEAELLARCEAEDILLAMQLTGPGINRYFELIRRFPSTKFATLFDTEITLDQFIQEARATGLKTGLYLDLNTGMNRSGIAPGDRAAGLYAKAAEAPEIDLEGLHAYDGHLRQEDVEARKEACDKAYAGVAHLKASLEAGGYKVPHVVLGGSPSFPVHAKRAGVICSPGTTLLWDERYRSSFPDMHFQWAALLFCRVISKPSDGLLCLDLGHKSVAPEMPFPRVRILGMEDAEQLSQSEEHLVIRTPDADNYQVGDHFYAVPMHVCPTVTKYPSAYAVRGGKIEEVWRVAARDHLWQEAASGLSS